MNQSVRHLTMEELETGLDEICRSPADKGPIMMIVKRPQVGERVVLEVAELDVDEGLVGDNWRTRGSSKTPDKSAHPEMQINVMNSRVIDLVAAGKERWRLAGDQLFIDLDLSTVNLPPATRLSIGSAVIEVTPLPHSGCKKFVERFGVEAAKFVNSAIGKKALPTWYQCESSTIWLG